MPYAHKLLVLKLTKINDLILHGFYETETQIFHLLSFSPPQIYPFFLLATKSMDMHTHVSPPIHVQEKGGSQIQWIY